MSFSTAISALVKTAVSAVETQFLETISKDYNLPLEELKAKYKVTAESASFKRPYKRKATADVVDETGQKVEIKKSKDDDRLLCKGTTAKREPCKFHALKGGCYCKRHQDAFDLEEAKRSGKELPTVEKPAKDTGRVDPVHTHKPDAEVHESCDLCQSHGPVLGAFDAETVEERLANIIKASVEEEETPRVTRPATGPIKTPRVEEEEEEEYSNMDDFFDKVHAEMEVSDADSPVLE